MARKISNPGGVAHRAPRPREPQAAAATPKRSWFDAVLRWAEIIEKLAKPVTYILAGLALLAVSFPNLRREWEQRTLPQAWYQVGTLRFSPDGRFKMNAGDYDAAAWNGGVGVKDLFLMTGSDILTTGTAVGRTRPTLRSGVVTVIDANKCLHVHEIAFGQWAPTKTGKHSEISQAPAVPLSTMTKAQLADPEATLKPMVTGPDCQPLNDAELVEALKADPKYVYPSDKKAEVCPRVIVWVQAQRVSC